ncbi:MAG: bifunctional metallophosphatase/5'-nucleotidase [Bacteroidales bacterium]|nr:bifunctional metallophosphatase/5'-nucleotidase [Bacteroidales bacterium]
MKKLLLATTLIVAVLCVFHYCTKSHKLPDQDIVIIFDNDVHGNMSTYAKMAEFKKEQLEQTPYVSAVSAGDFAQGEVLCSISHGMYAIQMMNKVGYDYVTLGNHEFDYGLEHLRSLTDSLTAKTLLCNLEDLRTNQTFFTPYDIKQYGDVKVGYIGVVAPFTKNSDSPQSFVDSLGNDIYTFHREDYFKYMQRQINQVRRKGADYVILISHLGDNKVNPETSEATIEMTTGLDAVIDGHAHNVIPERWLLNADGDSVLLTSSGSHFDYIGRLVLDTNGRMHSTLTATSDYQKADTTIIALADSMKESINKYPPFGVTEYDLAAFDIEHGTYDRNCYTNLTQLTCDAFYEYTNADIVWINSGTFRHSIAAGPIAFKDLLSAFPYQNTVNVAEFKGQRILDALEFALQNWPDDTGAFPQTKGLRIAINPAVHVKTIFDDADNFLTIEDGPRRVVKAEVFNKETGEYEPLDPDRTYSLASISYVLKNRGSSGILKDGKIIFDQNIWETKYVEDFIVEKLGGVVGKEYSQTKREITLMK